MGLPTEITAALLGALVGALITYRFALALVTRQHELSSELADREARRLACAKFRAALAPTMAFLYIAHKHGTHDRPDVDVHVKETLGRVGAAVEEFRPFVRAAGAESFQQAWEQYRATANADSFARAGEEWGSEMREEQLLEDRILALSRHAEI